jgi:hypothetical protein
MTMSLSDSQLDDLLREAEQRLPSTPSTLTPKTRLFRPGSTEVAQPLTPKDKLSVRQASALNPSEKVLLPLFFSGNAQLLQYMPL